MTAAGKARLPPRFWVAAGAWLAAVGVCAALWFGYAAADFRRLSQARRAASVARQATVRMRRDLTQIDRVRAEHAELRTQLHAVTNAHVLLPEMNFHDVGARLLLAPSVRNAGLELAGVREIWRHPLPVVDYKSKLHYDRIGIEVTGTGSYDAAARFVEEAEAAMPYLALASLTIARQRAVPEVHRISAVFEWPVQGVPPPPPRAATRRRR